MTDPAALRPVKMEDASSDIDPSAPGCKKGVPWSEEEHRAFLKGLEHLGKGNWRGISRRFVMTRSPTQVASHAQKYFLRLNGCTKRRSRFAVLEQMPGSPSSPKSGKVSSSPMMCASPNIKASDTFSPATHGQLPGGAGAIPSHTYMYPHVMFALSASSGPTTFLPPVIMATTAPSGVGQCVTWPAWPAADGKVHEVCRPAARRTADGAPEPAQLFSAVTTPRCYSLHASETSAFHPVAAAAAAL